MENLEGRNAVITGSAAGIGRSIALSLAGEGVNVVIADIDTNDANVVRDEARALGVKAIAVKTDVSKLASVEVLADAAYKEFGAIDILVNNAGVALRPFRATWDTDIRDFQWVMNINFWGVLHGFYVFVPRMRKLPGDKHIVATSSASSFRGIAGLSAYSASKMAIDGYCYCAREELASQNIGVSILSPLTTRTRISESEERLRPKEDQSKVRGVIPWVTYLGDDERKPATGTAGGAEPETIGPMVIEGIKNNVLHIVSDVAPEEAIRNRAEQIIAAGNLRKTM